MNKLDDEDRIRSLSELSDEWKDAVRNKSRELHDPNGTKEEYREPIKLPRRIP